jgi:DUF2075 family protein
MDNTNLNSSIHEQKEIKMVLIVNSVMILIGILAIFMFNYLDEKR